jgi:hypothetical protein
LIYCFVFRNIVNSVRYIWHEAVGKHYSLAAKI